MYYKLLQSEITERQPTDQATPEMKKTYKYHSVSLCPRSFKNCIKARRPRRKEGPCLIKWCST